jgi:hypothetical protein
LLDWKAASFAVSGHARRPRHGTSPSMVASARQLLQYHVGVIAIRPRVRRLRSPPASATNRDRSGTGRRAPAYSQFGRLAPRARQPEVDPLPRELDPIRQRLTLSLRGPMACPTSEPDRRSLFFKRYLLCHLSRRSNFISRVEVNTTNTTTHTNNAHNKTLHHHNLGEEP